MTESPAFDHIGLNMEQMAFDMTSTDFEKVVAQDLADTRTLKVTKTPRVRPLPSFGFEQLKSLVNGALVMMR